MTVQQSLPGCCSAINEMFCFFGSRAEQQHQGSRLPLPTAKPPETRSPKPELDLVSQLKKLDAKCELDIPTPDEMCMANATKLRYIDGSCDDDDNGQDDEDDDVSDSVTDDVFLFDDRHKGKAMSNLVRKSDTELVSPDSRHRTANVPSIVFENMCVETSRNSSDSSAEITRTTPSSPSWNLNVESPYDATNRSMFENKDFVYMDRSPVPGPRFKLLQEGDVKVNRLVQYKTVIDKIFGSKLLRKWEYHRLRFENDCISSKTLTGFFETPLFYSSFNEKLIEGVNVHRCDSNRRYYLQILLPDGLLLFQTKNAYIRDQWFYSVVWKVNLPKYRNILANVTNSKELHNELKNFINFVLAMPVQDESFYNDALEVISKLLSEDRWFNEKEEILTTSGSIIVTAMLPESLAIELSRLCYNQTLSSDVIGILHHVARKILKHNVDFGKAPYRRYFLQDFISALYRCFGEHDVLQTWVDILHGPNQNCPHPRVLPNLAATCFAAFNSLPLLASPDSENSSPAAKLAVSSEYDKESTNVKKISTSSICSSNDNKLNKSSSESSSCSIRLSNNDSLLEERNILCFIHVINAMSSYPDWAESLSQILQPIPIPPAVLQSKNALIALTHAIFKLGTDSRCSVHSHILPLREERPGWLQILCPTYVNAEPKIVQQWGDVLKTLLHCCCKRKCFLTQLSKMLPACIILSLRAHEAGLESLCLFLEWDILEDEEDRLEVVQALRSTPSGQEALDKLFQHQTNLQQLQLKKGPRRLTFPCCATDDDVTRLFSSGSFGNLRFLSLAFTHVTSAIAKQLIKLPSLVNLNLWGTRFGDSGILLIVEHLHKLQVLNLCETPVTDAGITTLAALTNLKKLNLNSTKLSAATWTRLKSSLPELQECDIRYTDAW